MECHKCNFPICSEGCASAQIIIKEKDEVIKQLQHGLNNLSIMKNKNDESNQSTGASAGEPMNMPNEIYIGTNVYGGHYVSCPEFDSTTTRYIRDDLGKECQLIREELITIVCEQLLFEHKELKKFIGGFARPAECYCDGCSAARALMEEGQGNETMETPNTGMTCDVKECR